MQKILYACLLGLSCCSALAATDSITLTNKRDGAKCPSWICGKHKHPCPAGQYMGPDGMCHPS